MAKKEKKTGLSKRKVFSFVSSHCHFFFDIKESNWNMICLRTSHGLSYAALETLCDFPFFFVIYFNDAQLRPSTTCVSQKKICCTRAKSQSRSVNTFRLLFFLPHTVDGVSNVLMCE